MKKIAEGIMYIILVILAVVLGVIIWKQYWTNADLQAEILEAETYVPVEVPEIIFPSELDKYMPEAGENTYTIDIAVAGDIVAHSGLNEQAYNADDNTYDYSSIFTEASEILSVADYATACLETTFPDTLTYTGYPLFASPTSLATALADAGVDMLSTASNHALDSYVGGLRRTLDIIDENGMDHVGTYRSQEERDENNGITLVEIDGVSIAFLAYSYGTNGANYYDEDYCINIYNTDYMNGTGDIRYDIMEEDIAAAKAMDVDIITVYMHWGDEYSTTANAEQNEIADFLFYEGVDVILGGHVHVLQPMEMREVEDKYGEKKTGFIVYCLGNFVSCQNDVYTNLSAILNLQISYDPDADDAWVSGAGYTPMFMVDVEDYGINSAELGWHYDLWNLHSAIDDYENGEDRGVINEELYNAMVTGLSDIHSIMNKDLDLYYLQG